MVCTLYNVHCTMYMNIYCKISSSEFIHLPLIIASSTAKCSTASNAELAPCVNGAIHFVRQPFTYTLAIYRMMHNNAYPII